MADHRIAWWQLRGLGRRAWLLVLCVALGVAARVGVGAFGGQFEAALDDQGRALLTADVEVYTRQDFSAEQRAAFSAALPAGSQQVEITSLVTMAATPDRSRSHLVRLIGAEAGWPYAGTLTLRGAGGPLSMADLAGDGLACAAQRDLLIHLGLGLGDRLRVGEGEFEIVAVLEELPGLAFGGFSIGSRVLIHREDLAATDLVVYGSQSRARLLADLPAGADADAVVADLIATWDLPEDAREGRRESDDGERELRVRSYRDAQDEVQVVFERLTGFLRLVALCGLVLAGVGIAAVVRSHVADQVDAIALLQVLGASARRVATIFAWQIVVLAVIGSLLGAAIGTVVQIATVSIAGAQLPVELQAGVDWPAIAWGLVLGTSMAVIAAAGPVAGVLDVRPALVMRREAPPGGQVGRLVAVAAVAILVLVALASWEVGDLLQGAGFVAVLLAATLVIAVLGALLLAGLARLADGGGPFAWRHGLANLWRSNRRPLPAVIALGVAATLLGAVQVQRASIASELDPMRQGGMASLFVINLQPDDLDEVRALVHEVDGTVQVAPMLRARLASIADERIGGERSTGDEDERRRQRWRRREQNLSWRDQLGPDEEVVAGEWLDPEQRYELEEVAEASLEVDFAGDIGAELGDVLTFDVQGIPVRARVTSLRKVDWLSFRPNFFVLLSPGLLADSGAPADWVAGVELPDDADRLALQARIVAAFPQASVFDVEDAARKVITLIDQAMLAVAVLAFFALGAGLVVLAGIVAADARSRREEAALLRVLGARDRTLVVALGVEFAAVGACAGVAGAILAVAVARSFKLLWSDVPFVIPWLGCALLAIIVAVLTLVVGLLSSRRVLRAAPLVVLRE